MISKQTGGVPALATESLATKAQMAGAGGE